VLATKLGSLSAAILVFAVLASSGSSWAENENGHAGSNQTVVALAVRREIRASKLAERKDVCVAVWVENEMRDPSSSLLKSPPLIGFGLHKLSWCAPRCRDNPKAGELPNLICDKMPRGVTIRVGSVLWNNLDSAAVSVETDDNSLKKADFGLILRKGNYKFLKRRGGQWKFAGYESLTPHNASK
jgi:hypothetical protein